MGSALYFLVRNLLPSWSVLLNSRGAHVYLSAWVFCRQVLVLPCLGCPVRSAQAEAGVVTRAGTGCALLCTLQAFPAVFSPVPELFAILPHLSTAALSSLLSLCCCFYFSPLFLQLVTVMLKYNPIFYHNCSPSCFII